MKNLFFTVCFFLTVHSFCFAQEDKAGLARVNKVSGTEVYVMSEPLRKYTVTGEVTADDAGDWVAALAGEETHKDITAQVKTLVENAKRKAKKKKFEFDAILTTDGATGTCIKWTE